MSDHKKYYDILGVESNSSASDIKKVYLKLAKRYHPDTLGPDALSGEKKAAEEYFKRIQDAYEIIYNEAVKRETRGETRGETDKEEAKAKEAREREARKIKCPNCEKEVIYGTKFCGVCGVDLRSFFESKDGFGYTNADVHPWHRFFARLIDYWSMEIVLLLLFPALGHENYTIIFMLSIFLWIFVECGRLSQKSNKKLIGIGD